MRDMTQVNGQGIGKSRGFAFVNFTEHAHALQVLRTVNNNPEIFGENKVSAYLLRGMIFVETLPILYKTIFTTFLIQSLESFMLCWLQIIPIKLPTYPRSVIRAGILEVFFVRFQ